MAVTGPAMTGPAVTGPAVTGPSWPRVVRLTSDELTAIAHGLGAAGFPGVPYSSYDALDGELHPLLDKAFLASLAARGLLVPDDNGDLEPTGELADLLRVAGNPRGRIAVEQVVRSGEVATLVGCELMTAEVGLLRHWIGDPIHALELSGPETTLTDALGEIVARSLGGGQPPGRRRRGRVSELADLLPQRPAGRLRSTMMMRDDNAGADLRVTGLLGVFDGGPGDLWLVRPCDDGSSAAGTGEAPEDLEVFVEPAAPAEVDAALRDFTADIVPAR
jgi:hypothetical protein